ncbi:MAG: hypothetical protein KJ950_04585 [Proteobacteria bacterium]|nr:hypothetical protein [Pseudomonadota bacterium]MBU1688544.1 hypothetical protein [Pseudomonadota bacterium]
MNTRIRHYWAGISCLILVGMLCPGSALAEEGVHAWYLNRTGNKIRIAIDIKSPPPPVVIVMQKIPEGVTIVSSQPRLQKKDSEHGEVKWLLRNLKTGRTEVVIQMSREVVAGELSGDIRWQSSFGKGMVRQTIE